MQYALKTDRVENAEPIIAAELADNFAAETWAKNWVRANARGDRYILERLDGKFRQHVFRTQGGQWYVTPH